MSIRRATPEDLEPIMAIEHASFPTDAWSPAMMREELRSPHGHYIVLETAGRIVGYAGLRAPRGATDADIQTIALAESVRGRGQGRALLCTLIAEASARGARDLFLEVRADNPVAQALYASEGFAEAGRRPRYYQPDDVDAVVMKLDVPAWAAVRGPRREEITPREDESARMDPPEAGSPPEPARPGAGSPPEPTRPGAGSPPEPARPGAGGPHNPTRSEAGACT